MRVTLLALALVSSACRNDYGQFEFGDVDAATDASGPWDAHVGPDGEPVVCRGDEHFCGGRCVSRDHREHCGSCGNDCTALGFGAGFVCSEGACGCGLPSRCGEQPGAECASAAGVCECGGEECRRGEACAGSGASQSCACNGEAACAAGQVCCPSGCSDGPC